MADDVGVRDRILGAAVALLRTSGVKKLAQPQVAKAAGVPQGHLTYYFPKKADLLAAVAGRFIEMMEGDLQDTLAGKILDPLRVRQQGLAMAAKLIKDRSRSRMLLGLVVEAEESAPLRTLLAENAGFVRRVVAGVMGVEAGHPDADLLLATLWGLGLQQLILGNKRSDADVDVLLNRLQHWLAKAREPANQDVAV